MTFDKSKVYTALNADELELESEVILADNLDSLRYQVESNSWPERVKRLDWVMGASFVNRFKSGNLQYNLAYLVRKVEETKPEEKKWIVYLARQKNGLYYLTACREDVWESVQKDYHAKTKLFIGTESEVVEWYNARKKFTEVIKAWEDGKQIQFRCFADTQWLPAMTPNWDLGNEYRIKPEKKSLMFIKAWAVIS